MKTTVVKHKLRPGDRCIAHNYRSKGVLEPGEVMSARVSLDSGGGYIVSYRVMLDRKSKPKYPWREGNYLFLNVRDDQVEPI